MIWGYTQTIVLRGGCEILRHDLLPLRTPQDLGAPTDFHRFELDQRQGRNLGKRDNCEMPMRLNSGLSKLQQAFVGNKAEPPGSQVQMGRPEKEVGSHHWKSRTSLLGKRI